jgi:TolB protein
MDVAGGNKRTVATGEDPAWGPDSRHLIFTEGGTLYMVDTVSSQKTKVLGGLGKITEPSWSR